MDTADRDEAAAMVRAYNDWYVEECRNPSGPDHSISDSDDVGSGGHRGPRCEDWPLGCHAVSFSSSPYDLGLPSLYSRITGIRSAGLRRRGHRGVHASGLQFAAADHLAGRPDRAGVHAVAGEPVRQCGGPVVSPHLPQVPHLRVALSEGGIGWLPYFLERVDYIYSHTQYWSGMDLGGRLPSEIFAEHVILCFIDDAVGIENRHHLNLDNITWGATTRIRTAPGRRHPRC